MKKINLKRLLNIPINFLLILSWFLTIVGLLLILASLKLDSVSSGKIPLYSRYNLAMEGIKIFEGEPSPYIGKVDTKEAILATVLEVDHPSWPVMFDFITSEIAIRKSERNEPLRELLAMDEQSSEKSNTASEEVFPEINFDRIKTIFVIRLPNVPKVGSKPLIEPYRTIVLWPTWPKYAFRRVYDFLSFEEFRLDMKKMLAKELLIHSAILTLIAVVCAIVLHITKWSFRSYLKGESQ